MSRILVITTGGTIGAEAYPDPKAPPIDSKMPGGGQDLVIDAIGKRQSPASIRTIRMEPRDSKQIDQKYRMDIIRHAEQASEKLVLLTVGTDRIVETADAIHRDMQTNEKLQGKSFMLIGAMTPLANGPKSDGYQNLDHGLSQLEADKPLPKVSIVLSDFDMGKNWLPKLYDVQPGQLKKVYAADGRYNRLEKIAPDTPTIQSDRPKAKL